jgi:serine protease Do
MRYPIQRLLGAGLSLALLAGCSVAERETSADPAVPTVELAQAAPPTSAPTVELAQAAPPTSAPTVDTPPEREAASETAAPVADTASIDVAGLEQIFTEVYERVSPSVVTIQVTANIERSRDMPEVPGLPFEFRPGPGGPGSPRQQPRSGLGSGFVWDDQGHIVTNNHVVERAGEIAVVFADGSITSGEVIGADPQSDLAVVKINPENHMLVPVEIADSTRIRVGEIAIAIGNPFGEQSTMTTGIISALGRQIPVEQDVSGSIYTIPDIIQTDAAINPGNSGGPLLDNQGRVIGVNTAIVSPSGTSAGLGYAVPAVIVQKVVPALIAEGSYAHPWLGISGTALVPELAEAMELERGQRGALVATVAEGSPADEAGLRPSEEQVTIDGVEVEVGGDVITSINGAIVQGFDDLTTYLARNVEVGDRVALTVLRDGTEETLEVTLAARPDEPISLTDEVSGVRLGIEALTVTPEVAEAMGLDANQRGVLIGGIAAGSPADRAGLRGSDTAALIGGQIVLIGGDIITAVEGTAVASVEELRAQLQEAGADGSVTLTLLRDGEQIEQTVGLN